MKQVFIGGEKASRRGYGRVMMLAIPPAAGGLVRLHRRLEMGRRRVGEEVGGGLAPSLLRRSRDRVRGCGRRGE